MTGFASWTFTFAISDLSVEDFKNEGEKGEQSCGFLKNIAKKMPP
jgi:hypothetical protein